MSVCDEFLKISKNELNSLFINLPKEICDVIYDYANNQKLMNAWIDFIFLDTEERRRFAIMASAPFELGGLGLGHYQHQEPQEPQLYKIEPQKPQLHKVEPKLSAKRHRNKFGPKR
jgi:hypothetical protein